MTTKVDIKNSSENSSSDVIINQGDFLLDTYTKNLFIVCYMIDAGGGGFILFNTATGNRYTDKIIHGNEIITLRHIEKHTKAQFKLVKQVSISYSL